MRRLIATSVSLALVAGAGALLPTSAAVGAEPVAVRVMPAGDSITAGVGSTSRNGYRGELYSRLASTGYTPDFAGENTRGTMADPDNEGFSGWTIDQLGGVITRAVTRYQPSVVTLHIGTNDIDRNIDLDNAPARLGRVLDRIYAAQPTVTIALATLVPARSAENQPQVAAYNERVRAIVSERQAAGRHIVLASMAALTTADLADGLHPNDGGYVKMATAFASAVGEARTKGWLAVPKTVNLPQSCAATAGRWGSKGQVATGTAAASTVRFADFDGDGRADYWSVADDGSARVRLNTVVNGTTTWRDLGRVATGTGAPAANVRIADYDGDGKADYIVVADTGAAQVWINRGGDGRGGWEQRGQIASGVGAPGSSIRFADFDGDGRADYLVLRDDGAVDLSLNRISETGAPGWYGAGRVASGTGAPGSQVLFADVDCDRKTDYLVIGARGSVDAYLNRGGDDSSGYVTRKGYATGTGVSLQNLRFGDLEGDGRADYLVLSDAGAVTEWQNNGGDPAV